MIDAINRSPVRTSSVSEIRPDHLVFLRHVASFESDPLGSRDAGQLGGLGDGEAEGAAAITDEADEEVSVEDSVGTGRSDEYDTYKRILLRRSAPSRAE